MKALLFSALMCLSSQLTAYSLDIGAPPKDDSVSVQIRQYLETIYQNWGEYEDRGNATGYDWDETDLTTNGDWHALDLSSVIPQDTKLVLLRVTVEDDVINRQLFFRQYGNDNTFNASVAYTQVADQSISFDCIIAVDSERRVEYLASNATWTRIDILVKGWWR